MTAAGLDRAAVTHLQGPCFNPENRFSFGAVLLCSCGFPPGFPGLLPPTKH